ncbi:MAG: FtsW/RodA/SpoVE family cell cycle protein [Microbacteriaceae bacterium]
MSASKRTLPPVITVNETAGQHPRPHGLRTPKRIRNLELLLLLGAFGINFASLALVRLGVGVDIPMWLIQLAMIPTIATVVLHIVLRITAPDADPFIVPIATLLTGIGTAVIHRIDLAKELEGWQSSSVRQLVLSAIAVLVAAAVLIIVKEHRILQRFTYLAMLLGIVLLMLPILPGIGRTVNGASIWIDLGFFTIQPGEFAKIALAVFFAGYLTSHREILTTMGPKVLGLRLPRLKDLGPIAVVWLASVVVLVMQRDLGTSLLYFGLFLVMLYLASGKLSWIIIGFMLFSVSAVFAYFNISRVQSRVDGWLNAFDPNVYDAQGGSYQLVQGMFGLSHGGLFGTGLGKGRPEITPLAESDYIFTSIGEELGLVGLFAILVLYMLLISRGFKLGISAKDDFGKLLAAGLSFTIALQCFIVIGGVTRVIPLTGLTTPFLAAGGSSLLSNWIVLAILLRVSNTVRNQPLMFIATNAKSVSS